MLWLLLVYVMASGGFHGVPVISPAVHGAQCNSQKECMDAASFVQPYSSPGTSDIASVGIVATCIPVAAPQAQKPSTQTVP